MIKVSSKGRYGVKAVYELALRYGQGPVAVTTIARAQNMSEQYLEQLMPSLKRAAIVVGMRGAQGGYMLAKHPSLISVNDVVTAVEGPIILTDCSSEESIGCLDMDSCVGPDVWSRVQEAVTDTMVAMSFEMLIAMQRGMGKRRLGHLLESRG
ncbi:MAG: RrF2 family transcriptional regulator [Sulfobacillus sp.]